MTTRRSPCTVPVSRKAPPRGCCRVMFLTQVASLSSHSSIRERICPPNRGPCFRTSSLAASENWDRLAGLYLSRDRRSFTTGNKRDEGKDYLAWKAQKHVWRRRGPERRGERLLIPTEITPTKGLQCFFCRGGLLQLTIPTACLRHWNNQTSNWIICLIKSTCVYVYVASFWPLRPPVRTELLVMEEIHMRWSAGYWSQRRISGQG